MGPKDLNDIRKNHNLDLIRRMKNGESLRSFDSTSSWFPPRPTIQKDPAAIARLYGSNHPKTTSLSSISTLDFPVKND